MYPSGWRRHNHNPPQKRARSATIGSSGHTTSWTRVGLPPAADMPTIVLTHFSLNTSAITIMNPPINRTGVRREKLRVNRRGSRVLEEAVLPTCQRSEAVHLLLASQGSPRRWGCLRHAPERMYLDCGPSRERPDDLDSSRAVDARAPDCHRSLLANPNQ
jgi:hypothetical protein